MKTIIVNIPEKEESFFLSLLKKFHFKSRVLSDEEMTIDKWDNLSEEQEEEIEEAIAELDEQKGIPHSDVMAKFRRR